LRLTLRVTLVVTLNVLGVPPVPAESVGSQPLAVTHDAVACMIAERHPVIEANLAPMPSVRVARVFFHSSLSDAYYYVEMESVGERFVGTLPRPRAGAGPVTYYVEGLAREEAPALTPEVRALVVEAESECNGRLAAQLPGTSPVRVFSLDGSTALPPGFAGVGTVVADRGQAPGPAAAAGPTPAPAPDSEGRRDRKIGAILLGATALGIGTVIVTSDDDEPPPASPSR
jgi:hypothetical protein